LCIFQQVLQLPRMCALMGQHSLNTAAHVFFDLHLNA
jgi:hypothetical protein